MPPKTHPPQKCVQFLKCKPGLGHHIGRFMHFIASNSCSTQTNSLFRHQWQVRSRSLTNSGQISKQQSLQLNVSMEGSQRQYIVNDIFSINQKLLQNHYSKLRRLATLITFLPFSAYYDLDTFPGSYHMVLVASILFLF